MLQEVETGFNLTPPQNKSDKLVRDGEIPTSEQGKPYSVWNVIRKISNMQRNKKIWLVLRIKVN